MSRNDLDDNCAWDLSEADRMSKARNLVRSHKHLLLIISVPCSMMGSDCRGVRDRVNKHVEGWGYEQSESCY